MTPFELDPGSFFGDWKLDPKLGWPLDLELDLELKLDVAVPIVISIEDEVVMVEMERV